MSPIDTISKMIDECLDPSDQLFTPEVKKIMHKDYYIINKQQQKELTAMNKDFASATVKRTLVNDVTGFQKQINQLYYAVLTLFLFVGFFLGYIIL